MPLFAPMELFDEAHSEAGRQDLLARLLGRPNDLIPFEALIAALRIYQQIPHRAPEMVPLDRIVGSVGRYHDFTRDFLPRGRISVDRWAGVAQAMYSDGGVPPIELLKVGGVYFVADGNHRVSVARASGLHAIDAYITEYPIDPGLQPGDTLDQALLKAGRARFLAETKLDQRVPDADIRFTEPGGETRLLEHIAIHQHLLGERDPGGVEPALEEAAVDWYWNTYRPIVAQIEARQLLRRFPDRTMADLYIWIWGYMTEIARLFGEEVGAEEGAALLELRPELPLRRRLQSSMERLLTRDRHAGRHN
jgi:hypothetical protein